MNINLITGGTGFLGQNLISKLLQNGEKVFLILRGESDDEIKKIIKNKFPDFVDDIVFLKGDILEEDLALAQKDILNLKKHKIIFWHLAANLSFATKDRELVYRTNFFGTKNVVNFANKIKVQKLNYVSTAYVSGEYSGKILEDEMIENPKFRNTYEESKYMAEKFLRKNFKGQYLIFRPSIILGDVYTGKATGCTFGYYRFSYMFYLFKLWVIKKLEGEISFWKIILKLFGSRCDKERDEVFLPWIYFMYIKRTVINLVPVDFVVESMLKINFKNNQKSETIHLTNKKVAEGQFLMKNIFKSLGYKKVKYVVVPKWFYFGFIKLFYYLTYPIKNYTKSIYWYLPYFTEEYDFDYKNSEKYDLDFDNIEIDQKYIEVVNDYAKKEIFDRIKEPKL